MKMLCFVTILAIFLNGCAVKSTSFDGLSQIYSSDAESLAELTAKELRKRYSPAQTSLALSHAPGAFGSSLEQALRNQGFAVQSADASGIKISYRLDILEDTERATGYLQVLLPDGQFFTLIRQLSITEPPFTSKIAESKFSAEKLQEPIPLPESPINLPAAKLTSQPIANIPFYTVHTRGSAASVAKRNKVSVADFCRWNNLSPKENLYVGHRVYLSDPSTSLDKPAIVTPEALPIPVVVPVLDNSTAPSKIPAEAKPIAAPFIPEPVVNATLAPTPVVTKEESVVPAISTPIKKEPEITVSAPLVLPKEPIALAKPIIEEPVTPLTLPENLFDTPAPLIPIQEWVINAGGLRAQLSAWAARAGYQLIWKANHDYNMESHASFQGEFLDVIRSLFSGLQRTGGYALRITVYQGNKVMEVREN